MSPAAATALAVDQPPLPAAAPSRKLAIICSKGSLDVAYPGLILANAARMSGVEAMILFTFWGLDIVNQHKADHLHGSTVGNPAMPIPTLLGGLPGIESLASARMRTEMAELEIPAVPEFLQLLVDSGCELYACQLAMEMFTLKGDDLVPQVKEVITAMDFMDKTEGAQVIFV